MTFLDTRSWSVGYGLVYPGYWCKMRDRAHLRAGFGRNEGLCDPSILLIPNFSKIKSRRISVQAISQ